MKLRNIFGMIVLAATLGFQGCTDVENAPSYTGRSEGPASKLNVMKDSVKVSDAYLRHRCYQYDSWCGVRRRLDC